MIYGYVWYELAVVTGLPKPFMVLITILYWTISFFFPIGSFLTRRFWPVLPVWATTIMYSWIAFIGLLLVFLGPLDVIRIMSSWIWGNNFLTTIFFQRIHVSIALLIASIIIVYGFIKGRQDPVLEKINVEITKLGRGFDTFKIVQISDLHLGGSIPRDTLKDVVEKINQAKPDVVAITGDLIEGHFESNREMLNPILDIKTKYGIYFVTGNHDYLMDHEKWLAYLTSIGITVLRNERMLLDCNGDHLEIAGVDDTFGDFFPGHGPQIDQALSGRDETIPLVLLAHRPSMIHDAVKYGVDLQLSGHTHGGQIWPFHYLVRLLETPYLNGLYKYNSSSHLYVSRGTGYWGPPMRFPSSREISLINLICA